MWFFRLVKEQDMSKNKPLQRGQTLVLFAFAILALVGITALAIDGGNAFSDRRKAQNSADTAALAGALAQGRGQNYQDAAIARALDNGYDNNGTSNTVAVTHSTETIDNVTYEKIRVVITSHVATYFGSILGRDEVTNQVEAIARYKPAVPLFGGAALVATACSGSETINAYGNANVKVTGGSGVFTNSSSSNSVFTLKEENLQLTPPNCGQAVGPSPCGYVEGCGPVECNVTPKYDCPIPDDDPMLPKYTCDYTSPPGVIFPAPAILLPTLPRPTLPPGVYCVEGRFDKIDMDAFGVTIIMLNLGIEWEGNTYMNLIAPTSGPTSGIAIYLPPSNTNRIKLKGTYDLFLSGTVLAPSSPIIWQGDFKYAMHSQWIGSTIDLTGTTSGEIIYNNNENRQYEPEIELYK
jgi:Flp pilus assembly protein TadG